MTPAPAPIGTAPIGKGSAQKDPPAVQVDPKKAKSKGPMPSPPTPPVARTKAAKKAASKKKTSEKRPVAQKEIDPANLEPEDAKQRCAAIYKRERRVESRRATHELAKKSAKAARVALTDAEEELEKEIRDQRFGPGPLYSEK